MIHQEFQKHVVRYVIGFSAALCLSLLAYFIAVQSDMSMTLTMAILLLLAAAQLTVQLICFLHLGVSGRSRSRTASIGFTLLMMLIIVIGSLWIMKNLDYHMGMSGDSMNEYMKAQNKKGF